MISGCFHIIFIWLLFLCGNRCLGLNVYVNNEVGEDAGSCSSLSSPCKTISFAYKNSLQDNNITQLNLMLQGNYELKGTIHINISHESLENLTISPHGPNVYARVNSAGKSRITVACRFAPTPCIKYCVSFERLIFSNFSGLSVLAINRMDRAIVRNCHFVENAGSGILAMDLGLVIQNCTFERNWISCNSSDITRIGGAIGILYKHASNLSATITETHFLNNSACMVEVKESDLFDPLENFRYYGGALSVIFRNRSSHNALQVNQCRFLGNKALFGGALSIFITDATNNNNISITNSDFYWNNASKSGGAFTLKTFDKVSANSILFQHTKFRGNVAGASSGAGKMIFQNLKGNPLPVYFKNVTFVKNYASSDGALGISSYLRDPRYAHRRIIIFEDVSFIKNFRGSYHGSLLLTGTVKSVNVDLEFVGNVNFISNKINSALYVCGAWVIMKGNVTFSRNHAHSSGGAISLTDGSKLLLMPNCSVLFYRNFAYFFGGALNFVTHVMENEVYSYNPICFMQYGKLKVPASKWNVSMKFIENGAGIKGAAIFASTVRQCLWSEEYPYLNFKKVFRWSDRFVYLNNFIGNSAKTKMKRIGDDMNIATDVYKFNLTGPITVNAQPGDDISLRITAIDELNTNMTSLSHLKYTSHYRNGTFADDHEIVIDDPVLFTSKAHSSSFSYTFSSKDAYLKRADEDAAKVYSKIDVSAINSIFGAKMTVDLDNQICAAGFTFDSKKLMCVCDVRIYGLKWCSSNSHTLHIGKGLWANVSVKDPAKLITFICPNGFCTCRHDPHQNTCQFSAADADRQCHDDRKGTLCGQCKEGKSVTIPSYSCRTCSSGAGSILLFLLVIAIFIAICISVIYFNPGLSEYLKGVFFYTQILPYVCKTDGSTESLATHFSTMINSVAVGSMPVEMCLFDGFDVISAVELSYAMPMSCVTVLIIVYFLSKFRLLNFHRDSPFAAFWILISVVYKYLAETSLLSLACFKVDDEYVFFYDGSVKCFSSKHLGLFIPSLLILTCIVLPLPIAIVLMSHGYIRVPPHISDVVAKGYKMNCRWWSAVDLGRRVVFAAIFLFIPSLELKQALFIFASVAICLAHAIKMPYENELANKSEILLLGCLVLIAGFQAMAASSVKTISTIIVMSATILHTGIVIGYLGIKKVLIKCRRRDGSDSERNSRTTRHISPVGLDGKPYSVPKRVMFDGNGKKPAGKKKLREPLVKRQSPDDL